MPRLTRHNDRSWAALSQRSLLDDIRAQVIGNGSGAQLQSYLYANNKQLAQAQGTQSVALRTLALTGGTPVTETITTSGGEEQSQTTNLLGTSSRWQPSTSRPPMAWSTAPPPRARSPRPTTP